MLNQKNSKQLMQTLHDSQNSIKEVEDKLSIIDNELTKRLMVITNAQELALKQTQELQEMIKGGYDSNAQTKTVFAKADIVCDCVMEKINVLEYEAEICHQAVHVVIADIFSSKRDFA